MPEAVIDGTLLAFDYGTRRIGVAVGETTTGSARALKTLATSDADGLRRLLDEWQPAACVVGLPLDEAGEETDMSRAARKFGARLAEHTGRPVVFADERFTSVEAREVFAAHRARGGARRRDAQLMDAMAARLILEGWLAGREAAGNSLQSGASEPPEDAGE